MASRTSKTDSAAVALGKLAEALTPKVPPDKMKPADLLAAWDADPEDEALAAEVENRTRGQYVANPNNSVAIADTIDLIALAKRGAQVGPMWGDRPVRRVADRASGSNSKVRFNPYRPANALTSSGFDPALNVTFDLTDVEMMVKHAFVAMALDAEGVALTRDSVPDIKSEVEGGKGFKRRPSVASALGAYMLAKNDDDPEGQIAAAKRRLTHGAERPFARDDRSAQPATVEAVPMGVQTAAATGQTILLIAANADRAGEEAFRKHMRPLGVTIVSEAGFPVGVNVAAAWHAALQRASAVCVLVSADCLAERESLIAEARNSGKRLVPILYRATALWQQCFGVLQAIPRSGFMRPPDNDALWMEVAQEMRSVVTEIAATSPYDRLCRLLPAQFEEVIYRIGAPDHSLPPQTAERVVRALALVRWATASGGDLNAVIDRVSQPSRF